MTSDRIDVARLREQVRGLSHKAKDGSYEQRVAAIIERGHKGGGEASQRMARTVWKRKLPASRGIESGTATPDPQREPPPPT